MTTSTKQSAKDRYKTEIVKNGALLQFYYQIIIMKLDCYYHSFYQFFFFLVCFFFLFCFFILIIISLSLQTSNAEGG